MRCLEGPVIGLLQLGRAVAAVAIVGAIWWWSTPNLRRERRAARRRRSLWDLVP